MDARHMAHSLAPSLIVYLPIISLVAAANLPNVAIATFKDESNFPKLNSSCEILKQTTGKTQIAYCPNMKENTVKVEITLGESVHILCNNKGVLLTDFEVVVGYVKIFHSKKCNLPNKLAEIFTKWNITGVEQFNIQSSVDEHVLHKKLFDNIDVSRVKSIALEDNSITEIEESAFQDFVKLETISLRSNIIKNFPDFTYLKHIRFIDVSSNQITRLPDQLNLPSLQFLSLMNNNLTTLNESCFWNMSSLNTLEMRNNQITYLPEKILQPLTGLKEINLTGLIEIPNNFFKTNQALEKLMFSSIYLSFIPEDVFSHLTNLTTLILTDTSLETLPDNLLANQKNLRSLQLYNNRFRTLPTGIFRNLKSLESLHIYGNQLKEWNSPPKQLPKLKELHLFSNELTNIKGDFSNNMPSLTVLNLSKNKISRIDPSAFNYFDLDDLNLSHNNLSEGPDGEITFVDGMRRARVVNLAYNVYENFPEGIEAKTLRLNMAYNKIKTLELSYVINFDEGNFRNNAIERITFAAIPEILVASASEEPRKSVIDINDNPIDCGCSAFQLVQYFDGSYKYKDIYLRISLVGDVRCHDPLTMARKDVRSLKSQSFTCDYKEAYICPEKCSCALSPHYQSFNVTCNGRNLPTPPIIPGFVSKTYYAFNGFGTMFTINKLVVDLSNNSIKNFTERDSTYINASELYLANNELSLVNWLPPRLEVLQLSDNKLENLGYNAIMALNDSKNLKNLTLHDNLWNCNCKLLNFTRLVKAQHWKIPFENKILCTDSRKVVELLEGNICSFQNQTALIAIGACFFALLLLIGLIFILYYKYEYDIKVWIFSKPILKRFVTEEDIDKDRVYDAFISFSHKDEEFVGNQLVRVLEGGPNPYKLCIHTRDWIVGEFINKQIIDSVQKSRRTIIILSPDFLTSEWGGMEFRTAHTEEMKEEDPDLQLYLSTNTYLKWGDPWFWKKLKYVLPHKKDEQSNNIKHNSCNKSKNKKIRNIMVTIDKMDLINSPATPNVETPPAISFDPLLIKNNALPDNGKLDVEMPPHGLIYNIKLATLNTTNQKIGTS
ncbi:Tl [Trypoxylus dichotomus]